MFIGSTTHEYGRMVGDELRSRPSATFDDVCGDFGVDDKLKAKLAWAFV